jgi:tetratricopeptide (TPR) repeat protein
MAKSKKPEQTEGTIIENPDVLVSKTEEFFQDKQRRNILVGVVGVLVLAVAGYLLYQANLDSKNTEAMEKMFQAEYYFESDSLSLALNGDGLNYGFLRIINDYPGTDAANLASFYAGAIYLQLGDFGSAIRHLKKFSSNDFVLQARAYALTGDAYMEQSNYGEAADYYGKAADYKPNKSYTPIYLQKLAVALENKGDLKGAAKAYDRIISEYFTSRYTTDAKKHKARLEAMVK